MDDSDEIIDEEEDSTGPATLKRLREKLAKALEEKQEYLDQWQRSRADLANFRRDELQRSTDQDLRSKVDFAEAIIPALDAFEMAIQDKSFQTSDANMRKGVEAVYSNLLRSLERIHIERFDPTGEAFNPHQHEALRQVETSDAAKDHTVESLHRAGFKVGERIIRPAQVSVYSHTH